MWTLFFLIITFSLIVLPLLPGIVEWKRATDSEPLRVIQEFDVNIKYFANGLHAFIQKNFTNLLNNNSSFEGAYQEGALRNGAQFQSVGTEGAPKFTKKELSRKSTDRIILSANPLSLPSDMLYVGEVYCKSHVKMQSNSKARAILAEGTVEIEDGGEILRWVHSNQKLVVGKDFSLFGRASADESIVIHGRGLFERLFAKEIIIGDEFPRRIENPLGYSEIDLHKIANVKEQFERHWILNGDLSIPPNSIIEADLVATQSINVQHYSHIIGSIKSNHTLAIGKNVRVDGSVFCTGNIHIDSGAKILGPVVSEGKILVETNCEFGSPDSLTTLSAPKIILHGNQLIYGTVWAEEEGMITMVSWGGV